MQGCQQVVSLVLEMGCVAEPVLERPSTFSMSGNIASPDFEAIEFILDALWWDLGYKPQ